MSSATEETALKQIQDLLDQISSDHHSPALLAGLINAALQVPTPTGHVDTISHQAQEYQSYTKTSDLVGADLGHVILTALPAAWRGTGAESAAQAFQSVAVQSTVISRGFDSGYRILTTFAKKLSDAQKRDGQGRQQLRDALGMIRSQSPYLARFGDLATSNLPEAVHAAKSGCQDMLSAARSALGAAQDAITALNQSAEDARARRITSSNIDPLTAVSLAYTDPTLLSPTTLAQGSADIDALSAADRAEFEKLLAGAQSPTEAAYLWKALSAGYITAQRLSVIAAAEAQIGTPYAWGGQTPLQAFDCSGLTQWAAAQAGVNIPRHASDQWQALPHINNPSEANLQPGDLIFPDAEFNGGDPGHVMMYIGNGKVIEAPQAGDVVQISPLSSVGGYHAASLAG